ncbi:hypothetical protein [uncultured Tateyamaria sp.]|uniref:hypothetical protein n=1 Tax=uncultured Tateyamaria sp. TaxID=455651 RepID=UPI00261DFB95|nr:hypothetical protein [uncultured Tateyamaria sp.]
MADGLEAIDAAFKSMDAALTAASERFAPGTTPQELADAEVAGQLTDQDQIKSDLNSDFSELVMEYNEAGEARGELQEAREEYQEARDDVQDTRGRYRETVDAYRNGDASIDDVQAAADMYRDAREVRSDARESRGEAQDAFEEERGEFFEMRGEFMGAIREAERNGVDTSELREQFDQFTRDFAPFEFEPMPGDANGDLVVDGKDAVGGVGDASELPPGVETVAEWISDFIDAAKEEMAAKGDQFDGKEFAETYDFSQFAGEDPVLVQTFLDTLQSMSDRPLDLPSAAEITGQDPTDFVPATTASTDTGTSGGSTDGDNSASSVDASTATDGVDDPLAGLDPDSRAIGTLLEMLVAAGGDPAAMDFSAIQQMIEDGTLTEAQYESFRGVVAQANPDTAAQLPSFGAIASGSVADASTTETLEPADG